MREKYYAVHNILSFKTIDNAGISVKDWDIELRGFESNSPNNVDFVIFIGNFNPNTHNCTILDDDYYIKEDCLYCCRDSYQYAKWRLELSGFEQGNMTARIHSNLLGKMLIPELIINPLIWFKLNEKGYPVMHGSAVSRDGQAYIFAGRGGAGKSTIALNLVERGFKLLSEHFVILGKDKVLSFPTPFHIMDFNLAPIIRKNMLLRHRVLFQCKQFFRHVTGKGLATKILPGDILPENSLADEAKLQSVFLLLPRDVFRVARIGKEELINHLVANQKLETIPFVKYMMEYAYLFPESKMATHWARYQENLGQALAAAKAFYRVEVPLRYDSETMEEISRLVSEG